MIKLSLACAACATLTISSHALAQTTESTPGIADGSIGTGVGFVPFSGYGLLPNGFVAFELNLGDTLSLDVDLGGYYSRADGDFEWRRGTGYAGVGVRHYFSTASARPSVYAHATTSFVRERFPDAPARTLLAFGPELGAALDADLSDAVVFRLASALLSGQRNRIWGDQEAAYWSLFVGMAPRAELRIRF